MGGGSSSSNYTTSQIDVNTTTIVDNIIETDALAKALMDSTNATIKANELSTNAMINAQNNQLNAQLSAQEAQNIIKVAEAKAKLNQNALFFQELEGGIKKWAMVGGLSYAAYKIINKKPKKSSK